MHKLAPILFSALLFAGIANATLSFPREDPYYNSTWAKNLTINSDISKMQSLNGNQIHYAEIGRANYTNGTMIFYIFTAVTQDFPLVNGSRVTLPWTQYGYLCMPTLDANTTPIKKGIMVSTQDSFLAVNITPVRDWCRNLSTAFKIPVFVHGWTPYVVAPIIGQSYHVTEYVFIDDFLNQNPTALTDFPMFSENILTKGSMIALTMFQRTYDQETGIKLEKFAVQGNSKEGVSQMLLSAVDDRVEVLVSTGSSGTFDAQEYAKHVISEWNCTADSNITTEINARLFQTLLRNGDWVLHTNAGNFQSTVWNPVSWTNQIYAKYVLIGNDIGKPLWHESMYYPTMAGRKFLNEFRHPAWRYLSFFDDNPELPGDDQYGQGWQSMMFYAADLLLNGTMAVGSPRMELAGNGVSSPCTNPEGCRVTVYANATFQAGKILEVDWLSLISNEKNTRLPEIASQWKINRTYIYSVTTKQRFSFDLLVPQGNMAIVEFNIRQLEYKKPVYYWKSAGSGPIEVFPLPDYVCQLPRWDVPIS